MSLDALDGGCATIVLLPGLSTLVYFPLFCGVSSILPPAIAFFLLSLSRCLPIPCVYISCCGSFSSMRSFSLAMRPYFMINGAYCLFLPLLAVVLILLPYSYSLAQLVDPTSCLDCVYTPLKSIAPAPYLFGGHHCVPTEHNVYQWPKVSDISVGCLFHPLELYFMPSCCSTPMYHPPSILHPWMMTFLWTYPHSLVLYVPSCCPLSPPTNVHWP